VELDSSATRPGIISCLISIGPATFSIIFKKCPCIICQYVGYCQTTLLRPLSSPPVPTTHSVVVGRSFVYPAADIKMPPIGVRHLGSPVAAAVCVTDPRFLALHEPFAGFIWAAHCQPIQGIGPGRAYPGASWVDVAVTLTGAPYLWGGGTVDGIDCSGLVQSTVRATRWLGDARVPRDSDQQV
jgi:hypothetical protein